jgi:hypothetical protein
VENNQGSDAKVVSFNKPLTKDEKMELDVLRAKLDKAKSLLRGRSVQAIRAIFSTETLALIHDSMFSQIITALTEVKPEDCDADTSEGVQVFTAILLTPVQQVALEEILIKFLGPLSCIKEQEDVELVAGVVIKVGNLTIDGSLRSCCEEFDRKVAKGLDVLDLVT